jgi:hypothetical protein
MSIVINLKRANYHLAIFTNPLLFICEKVYTYYLILTYYLFQSTT